MNQNKALEHDYFTPLWIIAGPGTGKTHTLSWLVLKRLLVDQIPEQRLVITTFTQKAAAELEARLISNRQKLVQAGCTEASKVDLSKLHLGTLHALCSQWLKQERYEPTLHARVLEDELAQQFFVIRSKNPLLKVENAAFWECFGLLERQGTPRRSGRARGACVLFNRMTELEVDVHQMLQSGHEHLVPLAKAYQHYQEQLQEFHRLDQAHLQARFLAFLATPEGKSWLGGGFTVLVDEYQDTNPIQEKIYFSLTRGDGSGRDLTVVGDDDQSLYRFRGATVESLVDFDQACAVALNCEPTPVYLHENRRSHPKIVQFASSYIEKHSAMQSSKEHRVRAPNKPPLTSASGIDGPYPTVIGIVGRNHAETGQKLAQVIENLMAHHLLEDHSQIAVLTYSTREARTAIQAYVQALEAAQIPLYNPRGRKAHTDQRLKSLLGGMSHILDPFFDPESDPESMEFSLPAQVKSYVLEARSDFQALMDSGLHADLQNHVQKSVAYLLTQPLPEDDAKPAYIKRPSVGLLTLQHLMMRLLNFEPFRTDLQDSVAGERMKVFSQILESYASLFSEGRLRLGKRQHPTQNQTISYVSKWDLYFFHSILMEGIANGLNDPEDDDVAVFPGAVNIMTIHQSKGLEFDVVFVVRPDNGAFESSTHFLEEVLDPYAQRILRPKARRSRSLRVKEDTARLYFVAYTRAKRLLGIVGDRVSLTQGKWSDALGQNVVSPRHLEEMGMEMP